MRVYLKHENGKSVVAEIDSAEIVGNKMLLLIANGAPYGKVNCLTSMRANEVLDGLFEHGRFNLTKYDFSNNV